MIKNKYILLDNAADIKATWYGKIVAQKAAHVRFNNAKTKSVVKLPIHIQKKSDLPDAWLKIFKKYWDNLKVMNHTQARTVVTSAGWVIKDI